MLNLIIELFVMKINQTNKEKEMAQRAPDLMDDEAFEAIKQVFETAHSEPDPVKMRADIAKFDADIEEHLRALNVDTAAAIVILLQGRNFLARYLGDATRNVPEGVMEAIEPGVELGEMPNTPFELAKAIAGEDSLFDLYRPEFMPASLLRVGVLDDSPSVVEGMLRVLDSWPNISSTFYHVTPEVAAALDPFIDKIAQENDFLLIDEMMGDVLGVHVVDRLKAKGADPVLASISSGGKPSWADKHFADKQLIAKSRTAALRFVNFMASLIRGKSQ